MIALPQRKRGTILIVTAALLMIGAVYGLFLARSLLARATKVGLAPTYDSGSEFDDFRWMASNRLLAFHGDPHAWYPYILDLPTAQRKRLEPLHKLALAQHTWAPFGVHWQVSPDGKWLLWGLNSAAGPSEYCVAALDGSSIKTWRNQPRQYFPEIVWQADSRAWLMLICDRNKPSSLDHIRIYPLDGPRPPRTLSVQGLHIEPYLVGCLQGNRLLTCDSTGRRFSICALEAPARTLKQVHIQRNPTEEVGAVLASPDGTRLAWCTTRPYRGLEAAFQDQFGGKNTEVRLMVSGLDGENMREVGRFSADFASHGGERIGLCAWSDDGRHVILFRNNAFWSLPIED